MAEYTISTTNMPDHILEVVAPWCNAEVIRCKDCRFYEYDDEGWDNVLTEQYGEPPCICMYPDGNGDYRRMYAEPHDFCAWGEQRGDAE